MRPVFSVYRKFFGIHSSDFGMRTVPKTIKEPFTEKHLRAKTFCFALSAFFVTIAYYYLVVKVCGLSFVGETILYEGLSICTIGSVLIYWCMLRIMGPMRTSKNA